MTTICKSDELKHMLFYTAQDRSRPLWLLRAADMLSCFDKCHVCARMHAMRCLACCQLLMHLEEESCSLLG